MKKEKKKLANGSEVEITTYDTGTVVVEEKNKGGRLIEFREFYNLEQADRYVASLTTERPLSEVLADLRAKRWATAEAAEQDEARRVREEEKKAAEANVRTRERYRRQFLSEGYSKERAEEAVNAVAPTGPGTLEAEAKAGKEAGLRKRRFVRQGLTEAEAEIAAGGREPHWILG